MKKRKKKTASGQKTKQRIAPSKGHPGNKKGLERIVMEAPQGRIRKKREIANPRKAP